MAYLWLSDKFTAVDLSKLARNWRQTAEGTDVRMSNKAKTLQVLADANNRLLGRHPAPIFFMCQPLTSLDTTQADSTGLDPLYRFVHPDYLANARNHTAKIIAAPRTAGAGNCYAEKEGGSATEATGLHNMTIGTQALPDKSFQVSYPVVRGASSDSEAEDGVSTHNGYTVLDIVIQDDELDALDTSVHDLSDPQLAKTGKPVLADLFEDIRSTFHDARQYNLGMALIWAGQGVSSTPGGTDTTTIVVTSSSLVNVIDQTVTSRHQTTSPGILCPSYLKGRGTTAKSAGQVVRLNCRVYAESAGVSPGNDGTVRFAGPNGTADITVTGGAGLDWYGSADGTHINLSSNSNDVTDTAITRNKVDILASVAAGTLYIRGLAAWWAYE